MTRLTSVLASLALASTATAHFRILSPDSAIGSGHGDQNTSPCGGFTPSEDDETTDFYVGGDAVAIQDQHPQSDWLIRANLEADVSGEWVQLFPIYRTTGEGQSCQPSVSAPESWAGRRGVIGIAGSATDGLLFSCAAVRFVNGTAPDRDSCKNGTEVTMSFQSNSDLEGYIGNDTSDESTGSGSGSGGDGDGDDDNAASPLRAGLLGGMAAAVVGGVVMML